MFASRPRFVTALAISVAMSSACSDPGGEPSVSIAQGLNAHANVPACPGPLAEGEARCHARVVADAAGQPQANASPSGYGPADLQAAYKLPSQTAGAGQKIAIVDAYDYANAESDLAVYRSTFGLPPCTTANGCFSRVNQSGVAGSYPRANSGWSQEAALDLDMASAICPNCKIVLVEASSASIADLGAGVDTAARLGATVISNSYGASEGSFATAAEAHYDHPGIAVTVSSGDAGYGVEFPASSRHVTAVGGTTLRKSATTRGWSETAWSGAGSGCSAFIPKPTWQKDPGCARRTVADVAAVADPQTAVAVYWTSHGRGGWLAFGGTSVAAPVVAGVYALAANGAAPSYPYAHTAALFDVASGSNGTCGGSYLCTSTAGYDGPTGLGTPNGAGAF